MREVCATHWFFPAKATLAAHPQEGGDPALLGIVLQVWIERGWLNPHPRQGGGMRDHSLI
jgi:hypothetical protein